MKKISDKNMRKMIACIMMIMMLFTVSVSSFFVSEHFHHDCDGEDCPICETLQICENAIRCIGGAIVPAVLAGFAFVTIVQAICVSTELFLNDTLVSQKVRLNN